MLGANLGVLLYGDVSVMLSIGLNQPGESIKLLFDYFCKVIIM